MSRSELSLIEKAIERYCNDHFSKQAPLHFVMGVSGGMDSMALLYAFHRLNISAYIVHVNYQKRGVASDKDADLVARHCKKWGFEFSIAEVDSEESRGQNFQQWARNQRYRLFEEAAQKQKADAVAVAHHRDDQIETIIQKMFRGAGLASWTGMEVWNGRFFRPLINFSRKQVAQYVEQNDIPYRTDTSNLESDFARNFLRNEWFDGLSEFFPGWQQNILRVAEQADYFDQSVRWIADRITDEKGVDREELQTLSAGLQKAVLLHLLKQSKAGVEISKHALNQLEDLQQLQTGKSIQLTEELSILRDRDHYCILTASETDDPFEPLVLQKSVLLQSGYSKKGFFFSAVACDRPQKPQALFMDIEKLSWPLTLRRWKEGDRFQPLGMEGHQLVSDHLTNRKVSAAHKHKALVIESFEESVCAVIFPPIKNRTPLGTISEQVKWDVDTEQCMKITYTQTI